MKKTKEDETNDREELELFNDELLELFNEDMIYEGMDVA